MNQTIGYVATKTFYNLELWLSLPGVICFYGVVCTLGFFAAFLILPETENRTLEDIELHFSDPNRRLTDIQIKSCTKVEEIKKRQSDEIEKFCSLE